MACVYLVLENSSYKWFCLLCCSLCRSDEGLHAVLNVLRTNLSSWHCIVVL